MSGALADDDPVWSSLIGLVPRELARPMGYWCATELVPGATMFNDQSITVECSSGRSIKLTLSEARRIPTLTRRMCKQVIHIDGSDLDQEVRAVDHEFDKPRRAIDDLGR